MLHVTTLKQCSIHVVVTFPPVSGEAKFGNTFLPDILDCPKSISSLAHDFCTVLYA